MVRKVKILAFIMVMTMSLFAPMIGVKAASQNFSFYFDQAVVDGSSNGKYYSISKNKTVTAQGNFYLKRAAGPNVLREANCVMELRRKYNIFFIEHLGQKNIGTATLPQNAQTGNRVYFKVQWKTKADSDRYYLVTSTGSRDVYKIGSGSLSW